MKSRLRRIWKKSGSKEVAPAALPLHVSQDGSSGYAAPQSPATPEGSGFWTAHQSHGLRPANAASQGTASSLESGDSECEAPLPGLTGEQRYHKVEDINSGTHGVVVKAVDVYTGEEVAIKYLRRDQMDVYVERELTQHWRLHHPGIVEMREVFLTDAHLAMVMEYADAGDLASYVSARGRLPEDRAKWVFHQLLDALCYLHAQGIASRDIKMDNVLLVKNRQKPTRPFIKLCDLGLAKSVDLHSVANTCVGTLDYVAPEVLNSHDGTRYDPKVADIWSCGVMLYVMATGTYPFDRAEDARLGPAVRPEVKMDRIINGAIAPIPEDLGLSTECLDLIQEILVVEPAHRISLEGIRSHQWLADDGWADLRMSLSGRWRANGCRQSLEQVMDVFAQGRVMAARGNLDDYDDAIDDAVDDDVYDLADEY